MPMTVINLHVDLFTLAAIDQAAERNDQTRAEWIRQACARCLAQDAELIAALAEYNLTPSPLPALPFSVTIGQAVHSFQRDLQVTSG